MFKGEAASLHAILKTETIRVPRPLKVFALLLYHTSVSAR